MLKSFNEDPHDKIKALGGPSGENTAFDTLIKCMVGNTGQEFFNTMTKTLCSWMNADICILGIMKEGRYIETVSMVVDNEMVDSFSYDLKDTPCEEVVKNGYFVFPKDVASLFPKDIMLEEMGIVGYVGLPLCDKDGREIGLINVLSRSELIIPENAEVVMKLLAERASAELERLKYEEERLEIVKFQGVIEMAGAACHELNQPLQVALGNIDLLIMDESATNELFETLRLVRDEIASMGDITAKINRITRYERKEYLTGNIIDIKKASADTITTA